MPTGLRHRILTPGTNVRRTVHGAVNLVTGAGHHHISVKNVPVVFGYFLQQLLAEHRRMRVIEGAKYSPQDDPAERGLGHG